MPRFVVALAIEVEAEKIEDVNPDLISLQVYRGNSMYRNFRVMDAKSLTGARWSDTDVDDDGDRTIWADVKEMIDP